MDIEEQLRTALSAAAAEVHDVRALPVRRRRRTVLVLAAAAALIVGAGVTVAVRVLDNPTDGSDGDASCAYVVQWQGREYSGIGEQLRMLEPGAPLGKGVIPGCDDGNGATPDEQVALFTAPGMDPSVATVNEEGEVLLSDQATLTPALLELRTPVPCRLPGPTTLQVDVEGIEGDLPAPYRLTVRFGADSPLAQGYRSVVIPVRVEAGAPGADDEDLVIAALQEGVPLRMDLSCRGDRFVATGLRR